MLTDDQLEVMSRWLESYFDDIESYKAMGKPVPDHENPDTRGHLFALNLLEPKQRQLYEEAQSQFYDAARHGINWVLGMRVSKVKAELEAQRARSREALEEPNASW